MSSLSALHKSTHWRTAAVARAYNVTENLKVTARPGRKYAGAGGTAVNKFSLRDRTGTRVTRTY
eukprot:1017956-Prymnesium_polylepis.2